MFSSAVRLTSRDGPWNTMPMCRLTKLCWSTTSKPAMEADPEVGCSVVVRIDSAVVLPAPFGPRNRTVLRRERQS